MSHHLFESHVCRVTLFVLLAVSLASVSASYAGDPAVRCESSKLKESSKYAACRLKVEARAVARGVTPDFTHCEDKFTLKFSRHETKGAGMCPSEGDEASMNARITTDTAEIATLLSGVRYEDTGLGTVIDHQTGLEWQKTDDAGGLTDKDNTYSWTSGGVEPNGTVFTDFLGGLNNCESLDGVTVSGGYAGRCDWRMPHLDELQTIEDCSFGDPCIDQSVFGSTNGGFAYWSASTFTTVPSFAWTVLTAGGSHFIDFKTAAYHVRGVRAGQ